MRLDMARKPVDGSRGTPANAKRAGPSGGHQAIARAIDIPAVFFGRSATDERRHETERYESSPFPPHSGGGGRRPDAARRNDEADFILKRIERTEAHGSSPGIACGRIQPVVEVTQEAHRAGDRGVERVAVVDRVDVVAGA